MTSETIKATYRIETGMSEIRADSPEAAAAEFFRQIVEQGIVQGVMVEDENGARSYFEFDIAMAKRRQWDPELSIVGHR